MTKYEWEKELKKHISVLPKDEIERVMEYYNELFDDNIERGMSERDIVREFGNPFDVARRILEDSEVTPRSSGDVGDGISDAEFEREERAAEEYVKLVSEKPKESKDNRSTREDSVSLRKGVSIILHVFVYAVLGVVALSLFISGLGAAIGGIVEFVIAFAEISSGIWATVAKLGFAVISVGVGVLLGLVGARMGQRIFFKAKRYFIGKDVAGAKEQ